MDRYKRLLKITALILFGSLFTNICLGMFFFSSKKEYIPLDSYPFAPSPLENSVEEPLQESSLKNQLELLSLAPVEELLKALKNQSLVAQGYTTQDCALALLTTLHHFDYSKALLYTQPTQQRLITIEHKDSLVPVVLFPELSNDAFTHITTFVEKERWPYTPKGLFLLLQKSYKEQLQPEPGLIDTFRRTTPSIIIETLIRRWQSASFDAILLMLLEGDFSLLQTLYKEQEIRQDFSKERYSTVLLYYLKNGSRQAACFLAQNDINILVEHTDDATAIDTLSFLKDSEELYMRYIAALLKSARGSTVQEAAKNALEELKQS